jgi:hypothetical protein
MAERRKIFTTLKKRKHKKAKEHNVYGLEGKKSRQKVYVEHNPLTKDLFQTILDAQSISVFVKHGKEWEQMNIWDVRTNGKATEDFLKTTHAKYKPFGVQDFFRTPDFIDLPEGKKFRLVEVSVEQLTGKKSDIRVVELLEKAMELGLEPCSGKLGFEFEEAHRRELGGKRVKLVAKPSGTQNDVYFLSLQHDGSVLYTNAWKINTQHETLRANQKLIFAISQSPKK